MRFRGRNLYIFQSSTVKLKLENAGGRFYSVSKMCMERFFDGNFYELTILITEEFYTGSVLAQEFPIWIQFFPLDRENCAFFKEKFFWSKISLYIELQVLTNFDTRQEAQITYHKYMHGISYMFSILLQTTRGIWNSLICVVNSSNSFNSVFHKEGLWNLVVL